MESASLIIDVRNSSQDNRSLMMPHQKDAVDALNRRFDLSGAARKPQNGLLVMPTGSGKTYTAVHWLLNSGVAKGYRIVWLAHRQELIYQTETEFRRQAPSLAQYGVKRLGVIPVSGADYKMSMACDMDVNICCIQSVANPYGFRFIKRMLGREGRRKLIVVIDEAHHAVSPSYRKVLTQITKLNHDRILLGLTATPTRMQEDERNRLISMFDAHNGFVYEVKLKDLIRNGYLAKPLYQRVNTNITADAEYDLSDEDRAFFLQYGELSERLKDNIAKSSQRNQAIVKHYLGNREKYGKTLVFAVNKLHAQTLREEFFKAQVPCEYVISGEPGAQKTIARFKANEFRVLINVQILTEGSDVPDIHAVFLTRETNSDVLLMQMIGRSLRGEAAGGTKEAYIVDFHDKWSAMLFWLDPKSLDVFTADGNAELPEYEMKPASPDRNAVDEEEAADSGNLTKMPNLNELYMKLYHSMRAYVTAKSDNARLPFGWYSVVNENGEDDTVLVYDHQLPGYETLKKNGVSYVENGYTPGRVSWLIFPDETAAPPERDIALILDTIRDTGEMPVFYTFEARDALDVHVIARRMSELNMDEKKRDYWLKAMYDKSPILQALYKTFFMFRYSVLQAAREKKDSEIQTLDEREDLKIVPDYYILDELLDEVIRENPWLSREGIESVGWSSVIVRRWFGLCQRWDLGENKSIYDIQINRILSSPQIDREIIKYLLYHEMLHKSGYWEHDIVFREKEWAYPNSEEWDGVLDSMSLKYKLDIPPRNHAAKPKAEPIEGQEIPAQAVPGGENGKPAVQEDKQEILPVSAPSTPSSESGGKPSGSASPSEIQGKALAPAESGGKAEGPGSPSLGEGTATNPQAPGVVAGYKYCRNCGNRLPESARFCDRCGLSTVYTVV